MKGYYSFRLVLEDMLGILKILTKKFVSQSNLYLNFYFEKFLNFNLNLKNLNFSRN